MRIAQRTHTGLPAQRTTAAAPPRPRPRLSRLRRHRAVAPITAALVVGGMTLAWALSVGNPDTPAAGSPAIKPDTFASSAEARLIVAGPSAALPLRDSDWRLDGIVVDKSWMTGTFYGTATMTYTGKPAQADATVNVGLYLGTTYVGRLTGSVHALPSGHHALVTLSSIDSYQPGPYHYAFLDAQ
jgi:hypothetical protein